MVESEFSLDEEGQTYKGTQEKLKNDFWANWVVVGWIEKGGLSKNIHILTFKKLYKSKSG